MVCVRRYCEFLTEADHVQQVAWYVSQLRNEDQIDLYSQFLSTLKHEADKRLALSLAVENSLPVQDILSQVVKRIHDNEVSFNCILTSVINLGRDTFGNPILKFSSFKIKVTKKCAPKFLFFNEKTNSEGFG